MGDGVDLAAQRAKPAPTQAPKKRLFMFKCGHLGTRHPDEDRFMCAECKYIDSLLLASDKQYD